MTAAVSAQFDHFPPDQAINWVAAELGTRPEHIGFRRLVGGISTELHGVVSGSDRYVLRRFTDREWLALEPHLARHEAYNLQRTERVEVRTPRLRAVDEHGTRSDAPTVLMTRVAGRVELHPGGPDWYRRVAGALAAIHADAAVDHPWSYQPWFDAAELAVPRWSDQPRIWERIVETVRRPAPAERPHLIHRDFHPSNLLWPDQDLPAVIDWVNACRGPAGVDVGHCRLNLAVLHGPNTADAFLDAYMAETGRDHDPYWDLVSIAEFPLDKVYQGWTDLELAISLPRMRANVEHHAARALMAVG